MAAPRNTTSILGQLRALMKAKAGGDERPIAAYIVPTGDAHVSEYVSESEKRRDFLSGFTGSAGTAVVTDSKAALWTDGRYFLQAAAQMDSNWVLMKDGLLETPSPGEWLAKKLPEGSRVGVDPLLISAAAWKPLEAELKSGGHDLIGLENNLVDQIWTDQPAKPCNPVIVLPVQYTGKSWKEKVENVRKAMSKKDASVLVVNALDEIAWLLNLRGADIQFNPCFLSYAIITEESVQLFIDHQKVDDAVKRHLELGQGQVKTFAYDDIKEKLKTLVDLTKGKIWISDKYSNQALFSLVPENRRISDLTPIAGMKAVKNPTEIQGMKNAHIKDAVALCEYLWWLEQEIKKQKITEISGATKLEELRSKQKDFVSLSFDTISGFGSNGAVIHYRATEPTNKVITDEEIYLVDSGAQYKDGTTDVTRTVHFGTPTEYEKECFTKVLIGHIKLSSVIFPNGVKGHRIDCLARAKLWESGLDYLHGTGHGVGSFLNVHEGPCGISYRTNPSEAPLEEGMILSDEPGFYEDGKFGIRIENLVVIKKAVTKYDFKDKGFLTFEPITLVPIQTKLIDNAFLAMEEIMWLNEYHENCRKIVGDEMKAQGKTEVYNWLMRETEPIKVPTCCDCSG